MKILSILFAIMFFSSICSEKADATGFKDPSYENDSVWQIDGTVLRGLSETNDLSHVEVPGGITVISKAAFVADTMTDSGYDKIQEIVLPDSVCRIEEYAFRKCVSLRSINLPEGMTVIPRGLFMDVRV